MPNPFSLQHGPLATFESQLLHTREALEQLARSHRSEVNELCQQKERLSMFLSQSPAEACRERAEEVMEFSNLREIAMQLPNQKAQLPPPHFEGPDGQEHLLRPWLNDSNLCRENTPLSSASGEPKFISLDEGCERQADCKSKANSDITRNSVVTFDSGLSGNAPGRASGTKSVSFGGGQVDNILKANSEFTRTSAVTSGPSLIPKSGDSITGTVSAGKTVSMAFGTESQSLSEAPMASQDPSQYSGGGAAKRWKVSFAPRIPWSQYPEYRNLQLADFQWRMKVDTTAMARRRMQTVHQNKSSLQSLIVHPQGRIRIFWLMMSMILVLYDFVTVPISACFLLEPIGFTEGMEFISAVFWTLDLVFTFFTGFADQSDLEMRPQRIACKYLRTWFLFDAVLVVQEWLAIALANVYLSGFSFLRGAKCMGMVRLLRTIRLVRTNKWKPLIRQLVFDYNLTNANMALMKSFVFSTLFMGLILHWTACFWHALGEWFSDGWILSNDLESATVARRYLVSWRWTCARLYGIASGYRTENPWEHLIDSYLVLGSLLTTAVYTGQVTVMSITWVGSHTYFVRRLAAAYVKRHRISGQLSERLISVLKAATFAGAGEIVADEARLLSDLPRSLQEDLRFEARAPILCIKRIFNDMYSVNQRVVRHVCNQAVFVDVAVQSEVLFAFGDACVRMLFILPQCCSYMHRKTMHKAIEDAEEESDDEMGSFKKYVAFSEPVLWTTWEHRGTLYAKDESVLLSLHAEEFGSVILQYHEARVHAVKYAYHFVFQLNRIHSGKLTDEIDFNQLSIDEVDQEMFNGTDEDHFVFISHYKIEAGTEAALMRDQLDPILKAQANHPANNLRSPIFIDSEDLEDLAQLKVHVTKSTCLILMLTPGVLSRPWCLVEIVTAIKHHVRIVPVEVQRPGCRYQYPDEQFYERLLAGKFLDPGATQILENEGLTLDAVDKAIRQVFQKIALPFSPHKSKKIRNAELEDILKRCGKQIKQI